MTPTTLEILRLLARSKRDFDPSAIVALRRDLAALSPAETAKAFAAARGEEAEPRADASDAALAAIHRARRKLLLKTPAFLALLARRVEAELGIALDGLSTRERASAPQFVAAVRRVCPPAELAAHADAIARERSLAYDMA